MWVKAAMDLGEMPGEGSTRRDEVLPVPANMVDFTKITLRR